MTDYDFFKPISREEWEKRLEQATKDVMSKIRPGDTYEDFLGHVARVSYGLPPRLDE